MKRSCCLQPWAPSVFPFLQLYLPRPRRHPASVAPSWLDLWSLPSLTPTLLEVWKSCSAHLNCLWQQRSVLDAGHNDLELRKQWYWCPSLGFRFSGSWGMIKISQIYHTFVAIPKWNWVWELPGFKPWYSRLVHGWATSTTCGSLSFTQDFRLFQNPALKSQPSLYIQIITKAVSTWIHWNRNKCWITADKRIHIT